MTTSNLPPPTEPGPADDVNPPATDPENPNPNENDPDDAVAVNPPDADDESDNGSDETAR